MAQTTTANQRRVRDLCEKYRKELEQDDDPVRLRERLAAMAHALQITLCLPSSRRAAPHAASLEVLMRAVAHDIEGDVSSTSYVREKLGVGYRSLMGNLEEVARDNWTLQLYNPTDGYHALETVYSSEAEATKAARESLADLNRGRTGIPSGGRERLHGEQLYVVGPGGKKQLISV